MEPVRVTGLDSPPKTLGRYEIIGLLAHGGMASVYLGRHSGEAGFQRLYAIKVLHPHLADEESFVEMMLDEARLAARLHHPNVVPIVDLGTQDGHHYVVMEYVEGCAFSVLLTRNRDARPPALLLPLFLDALAGLEAAHTLKDDDGNSMGLVHRDVSPHNVLVGIDGTARLIDFGIAKAVSRITSTRPGQMKGKYAFMAPEQLINASNVDLRADIFSAGAMLWSALTGRRLFVGNDEAETVHNVLHLKIDAPSEVGLKPPAVLDAVVLRALERDPSKRFASAAEMEDALREVGQANRMLASKREIIKWITTAVGAKLDERRAIIRGVSGPRDRREASIVSTVSASGLRVMPSLESNPGLDGATPPSLQRPAVALSNGPPPVRRLPRWAPFALVALGLAVVVALPRLRGGPAPQGGTTMTTVAAPASLTPIGGPAIPTTPATPVTALPPTEDSHPTVGATAPPPAAASSPPVAVARLAPPAQPPAPAWRRPATTSQPEPTARAPAAHPAGEAPRKSWDNDSPLPPQ